MSVPDDAGAMRGFRDEETGVYVEEAMRDGVTIRRILRPSTEDHPNMELLLEIPSANIRFVVSTHVLQEEPSEGTPASAIYEYTHTLNNIFNHDATFSEADLGELADRYLAVQRPNEPAQGRE